MLHVGVAVVVQAFPMFLSMSANVTNWSADGKECSLVRADCGLALVL